MTSRIRLLPLFLPLVLVAACSMPPNVRLYSSPSPLREAAVGCWELESSPGLLGRPLHDVRVRLDTAAAKYEGMRMHLISDAAAPFDELNQWGTTQDGNVLQLWFNNGFAGSYVRVRIQGDQMRGRGRDWMDFLTFRRTGRVRGVRVPCPADSAQG